MPAIRFSGTGSTVSTAGLLGSAAIWVSNGLSGLISGVWPAVAAGASTCAGVVVGDTGAGAGADGAGVLVSVDVFTGCDMTVAVGPDMLDASRPSNFMNRKPNTRAANKTAVRIIQGKLDFF